MTTETQPGPGLYIHVPFCASKCPYCDFYSTTESHLVGNWLLALEKEMGLYASRFQEFDTVYLGGGTPTVLAESDIERIMESVHRHFHIIPGAEITIEANPGDITSNKAATLLRLGFNRISLGVQSFSDQDLSCLGRRHTQTDAQAAIHIIRQTGFSNLSIDLMYAIPGQDMESWGATLNQALAFEPEHLSCYQLTIKSGTPFGFRQEKGDIGAPGEAKEESFFLFTSDCLKGSGYIHYEVSNFASKPALFSAHNQKYWHATPYLGLGPAAHSFLDDQRWWNHSSTTTYNDLLNSSKAPTKETETLTDDQKQLEDLFLGFRTLKGIPLTNLQKYDKSKTILTELLASRLVTIKDNRVIPTTKGFLVADSLPLLFD